MRKVQSLSLLTAELFQFRGFLFAGRRICHGLSLRRSSKVRKCESLGVVRRLGEDSNSLVRDWQPYTIWKEDTDRNVCATSNKIQVPHGSLATCRHSYSFCYSSTRGVPYCATRLVAFHVSLLLELHGHSCVAMPSCHATAS